LHDLKPRRLAALSRRRANRRGVAARTLAIGGIDGGLNALATLLETVATGSEDVDPNGLPAIPATPDRKLPVS